MVFWQRVSLGHRKKAPKILVNRHRTPEKPKEPQLFGTGSPKDP